MELVPATVLTGFLGAGKSTLLKRVLGEAHGQKIAVIENEFGGADIDGEIIASAGGEQIVQLGNGCICCTIREDLRGALLDLAERRGRGEIAFDRLMIETTGLADPGPVAQTFFLDEAVARRYRPDAVVTLVDAKFGMRQLDERQEARRQAGFADRIFLSKTDLAAADEIEALSARLARINPRAPQRRVHFGEVALSEVFDVGGFNLTAELEIGEPSAACDGQHAHGDGHHHHHHHDDVGSFVFRAERPLHPGRFGQFLTAVARSHGDRLLRYKGVLDVLGVDRMVIFQGVHQLTSSDLGPAWGPEEPRSSKLVFIGLDLPQSLFLNSLQRCLA
jgi:G3E family GTPase